MLTIENKSTNQEVKIEIERGKAKEIKTNFETIETLKNLTKFKPESNIVLNSIPVKTINTTSLRSNISNCGFSFRLLNGSLLENITLQNNIEDIPKLYNLASLLGIDLIINQLPQGMETILNEYTLENDNYLAFCIELLRKLYCMPSLLIVNIPEFISNEDKLILTKGLKNIYSNNFLILISNV